MVHVIRRGREPQAHRSGAGKRDRERFKKGKKGREQPCFPAPKGKRRLSKSRQEEKEIGSINVQLRERIREQRSRTTEPTGDSKRTRVNSDGGRGDARKKRENCACSPISPLKREKKAKQNSLFSTRRKLQSLEKSLSEQQGFKNGNSDRGGKLTTTT